MNKRRKVSDYHEQIIELAPNMTVSELAKEINLAESSLSAYLKKNEIRCKKNRKNISDYLDRVEQLSGQGLNLKEIAALLDLNETSLAYQVKKKNIPVRNGKFLVENTEEERQVVNLHSQGFTYSEIAEELQIPPKRIPKYLKKHGIKTRTPSESFRCGFSLNENAFDDFSKEDTVYWFGWLLTDGCVSDRNIVSIALKSEDSEIVEGLKAFLNSDTKVHYHEYFHKQSGKIVRTTNFAVMSRKLTESLKSQNLVPRKSCREKLPNFDWLDGEHAAVFWRACIEGDGYVSSIEKDTRKYARLSLVGSQELLNGFALYVNKHCGVQKLKSPSANKKNVDPLFATIEYTCKDAYLIIKKLWSSGSIFLPRKQKRAEAIIKFYES